ncbi:MAG: adenylosuccinate lyase [bacterium]
MVSHQIDFEIYSGSVCHPEVKKIFSERTRIGRWLYIEGVLARSQADLGIIPEEAADEIQSKADIKYVNFAEIKKEFETARHTLMPVLKVFKRSCQGNAGEYLHYGATTQDILDTAEVLEIKDALAVIYRELRQLEANLLAQAEKHAATPMVARTHGQQALPTTLGMKVAVWIREIRRHVERLKQAGPRLFIGQLSGGVGTMAALGDKAFEVAQLTLERLGLKAPEISWHNSRDNIAELACNLSLIATTGAKIGNEIFQLQKVEFGELSEPYNRQAIGSSTMPHKSNPVRSQRIVALSRHVRHLSGVIVESMAHEHERDMRCLGAEWLAVPEVCIYTAASLRHLNGITGGMAAYPEMMKKNMLLDKHGLLAEWLMFKLAPALGKMKTHDLLHDVSVRTRTEQADFKESLLNHQEVREILTDQDLRFLDRPELYTGKAQEIVARVMAQTEQERQSDPESLSDLV